MLWQWWWSIVLCVYAPKELWRKRQWWCRTFIRSMLCKFEGELATDNYIPSEQKHMDLEQAGIFLMRNAQNNARNIVCICCGKIKWFVILWLGMFTNGRNILTLRAHMRQKVSARSTLILSCTTIKRHQSCLWQGEWSVYLCQQYLSKNQAKEGLLWTPNWVWSFLLTFWKQTNINKLSFVHLPREKTAHIAPCDSNQGRKRKALSCVRAR